ncbi:MAG: hypothetical protein ACRD20_02805 [Terriglobales bacterium]
MTNNDQVWLELCDRASKEQNPRKLLMLVEQINRLLKEREKNLRRVSSDQPVLGNNSGAEK